LKKWKSQSKAVEMTVNSKEQDFCPDFVQELGLRRFIGQSDKSIAQYTIDSK
jgi:hypothetical protein